MNNSPSESWRKCLKISFRVNLKNSSNDCVQVKSMETILQPSLNRKILALLTIELVKMIENDILTIKEKYSRSDEAKLISKWEKEDILKFISTTMMSTKRKSSLVVLKYYYNNTSSMQMQMSTGEGRTFCLFLCYFCYLRDKAMSTHRYASHIEQHSHSH